MSGETIAKVQCNSCGGRHNYRPVETVTKKRSTKTLRRRNGTITVAGKKSPTPRTTAAVRPRTSKKTAKKNSDPAVIFDELLGGRSPAAAQPYAINATLAPGDIISHSIFGVGVVVETIQPNKAEIAFQIGSKVLICQPAK